ncbi:MAG: hypothetical protein GX316_04420 [Firmicutes bacterium]|mgnify:CR=1 FL=1|nr:hypothetical protein [Bacillota bacterium]
MDIFYLGTGASEGWPALFCQCSACAKARELGGKNLRSRTSVQIDGEYKFDVPPDTYHHVLTHGLNLSNIKHLIVTHCHGDHYYWQELQHRSAPFAHIYDDTGLDVYGDVWVEELADWERLARGGIRFNLIEANSSYDVGDARLHAFQANHFIDKGALIYVFEKDGISLLYGNDTGFFYEEVWDRLKDFKLDVVSLDCTHGEDDVWNNHMGIPAILETRSRMLKEGIAHDETIFVATHFSHNGRLLHHELEEVLNPQGFVVAYDGMRLAVSKGK